MNRTDRMMAIAWFLRSRTHATAAMLAETFGVWYVQGPDSHSGTDRPLRIDRILDCDLTEDP
ncbi:MAG TPA: hypothetical protein VFK80_10395 [Limnochordia bacterium]|nr:hypothetical protein [Limnochordia bacterium]